MILKITAGPLWMRERSPGRPQGLR